MKASGLRSVEPEPSGEMKGGLVVSCHLRLVFLAFWNL